MSSWNAPVITDDMGIDELREIVANLIKDVDFIINGNVDWKNIRARSIIADRIEALSITAQELAANTITADKMNVQELSAIAANLGHITAGLIEAVEIFGSYIATSTGYPRTEISSSNDLFTAFASADDFIRVDPDDFGTPMLHFGEGGSVKFSLAVLSGIATLLSYTELQLTVGNGGDLRFHADGNTFLDSWSKLVNAATGNTLQQDLNDKLDETGESGSFETADGKTVTVINGAITNIS